MPTKETMSKGQLLNDLARAHERIRQLEEDNKQIKKSDLLETNNNDYNWTQVKSGSSKNKLRYIIDASPIPSALNDEQQNIIYLNPAFISTFGYNINDISTLDKWWPRAYPDVAYRQWVTATWQEHMQTAISEGKPFVPFEVNIQCKDGSRRVVVAAASPLGEELKGVHLVTLYDMTERKETEMRLHETLTLLENIVNSSPDLIFVKNTKLQTIFCNQAHANAVGKTREEMYGNTDIENGWDPELINGNLDKGIRGFVQDDLAALAGQNIHNPYDPANIKGEVRVFDTHKLPLHDTTGSIIGVLGVARDITERQRAEQELEQHRNQLEVMVSERTTELEEANEELKSFSYSVSHDLRAPLRAINGFSQALIEDYADQLNNEATDYLKRIHINVQHMGLLIDDMLSLSKITNSTINKQDINLSLIADKTIKSLKESERHRDVKISIASDIYGWGDARLMSIALDNLLGNAWKYTGKTKSAFIEFFSTGNDGEKIYHVRDNGVGFNMENADKLFVAFQRMHNNNEFEGTGIGLATVARIIRRHGGRVWAESEIGKGTTISFTLTRTETPNRK